MFYLQFRAKDSKGREAVQFSFWGDWVQSKGVHGVECGCKKKPGGTIIGKK